MVSCVLLAAALSYVIPAGRFERRTDIVPGRSVVVPGTYQRVEQRPVGLFQAMVAIPKGMVDAASVIFYVFVVGGAFAVVERTGALRRMVDWLLALLRRREILIIPAACVLFGLGGILIQMQEELIAFVPVLLLLSRRLGYDPLTAVAISLGAAAVGAAFSPINPFQVQIAQQVSGLPLLSGAGYRIAVLVPAMGVWIWATMRHATSHRTPVEPVTVPPAAVGHARQTAVLILVVATFIVFIVGERRYEWDFDQLAGLFFIMAVLAGLIGGLRIQGTADALVEGFRSMAYASLLIGFARGIYIVMDQGAIVDSIVNGLFAPLQRLPLALSALGMMGVQTLIHFPVPSTSGQAVLTLPILVPLSDLLGLSRQVTVLAYQYGAGLCELLTPTNGALMAMLAACNVSYDWWFRFLLRVYLILAGLAALALIVALTIGIQ
jgi:uncharacterized ion transporter superfamily protein YfcC